MRQVQTLTDNLGQSFDAHKVTETTWIDGHKVTREYVETYPVGQTDPDQMIGWFGSVQGFMESHSGACTSNF